MLALFILFFASSFGQYHDTTCNNYKCTRDQMSLVDHAKYLSIGNHTCNVVYTTYFPDGTKDTVVEYTAITNTFYDKTTGSIHSDFIFSGGLIPIDEYCNDKGGVCIEINYPGYDELYIESTDLAYGNAGTAARIVSFYKKGVNKKLKQLQTLFASSFGDVLIASYYSDDGHLENTQAHTCFFV
jgi:hypothetical protein